MIDMKIWANRMADDIIEPKKAKILATKFADEAAEHLSFRSPSEYDKLQNANE